MDAEQKMSGYAIHSFIIESRITYGLHGRTSKIETSRNYDGDNNMHIFLKKLINTFNRDR